MGLPCDTLIPAAILYDNPNGLSFEEFFSKVNFIAENLKDGDSTRWIKGNRYAFAGSILHIPLRKEYDLLVNSHFDEDLEYYREEFFPLRRNFKMLNQRREFVGKEIILEVYSTRRGYQEKDYVDTSQVKIPEEYSGENIDFFVLDVLQSESSGEKDILEGPSFYEKVLVLQ